MPINAEHLVFFLALLGVVAFLYASVGHGGASGYLALMALFAVPVAIMKPTALLLNILVSGVAFLFFTKGNHFRWRLFYPFAISSIPAAFLGGYINVSPVLYKQILGVCLLFAILRILGAFGRENSEQKPMSLSLALLIGFVIGLFSGMIGIGGGIILTPVILLLAWGSIKEAAAVSALFIFVNSVSGMVGYSLGGNGIPQEAFTFVPVALVGGILGGYFGSSRFTNNALKYVLSTVLLVASVKLLLV